ncbi:MAG: NADH-quinone oxidoreductase subunit H [Candidatus Hydrogenedentes bacterium]|nr:NADH-quinone oxidoreductase subunit H [Candidatus Hydrogenedentota bacterium]
MARFFDIVIHLLVLVLLPPLVLGIVNKTKAWFGGRVGPPLTQVYSDVFKLMRKDLTLSRTTTWVFLMGPAVSLTTVLLAGLLIPFGMHAAPVSFTGDVILAAYLLALGRFFTASAALDTGSSFEGMGAAREVTFSSFAEPALFLGFAVLARLTESLSLSHMLAAPTSTGSVASIGIIALLVVAWFAVLLSENSRIPVDDPNTHLELTMIHEVMVLDHSGPAFGMIVYSAAVKLFVMSVLVVDLIVPKTGLGSPFDWLVFLVAMAAIGIAIGIVESSIARLRMVTVPKLLVSACLLAAFGASLLLR